MTTEAVHDAASHQSMAQQAANLRVNLTNTSLTGFTSQALLVIRGQGAVGKLHSRYVESIVVHEERSGNRHLARLLDAFAPLNRFQKRRELNRGGGQLHFR